MIRQTQYNTIIIDIYKNTLYTLLFKSFWKEMNTVIQQWQIKMIKNDSKDISNITF